MSFSSRKTRRNALAHSFRRARPLRFERLEDRCVPATFTVTNTLDSSAGSLRQAVLDANANLGADIIQFAPGVTGTITLTSGELGITDAVDLQGPGAGVVAVSGNHASRVFAVSANATISGLTITGGSSSNGGGVSNAYGTLAVRNSTLSDNTASAGGGIYNAYGALTVDGCTLIGNSASADGYQSGGGAIYNANYGTQTAVQNSTLRANSGVFGGGINNNGTLTVQNSTLSGNSAKAGGGVFNVGTLTVQNSTVSGNSAGGVAGTPGAGGGISNAFAGSTLTVSNSTVNGNWSSYQSGGIANGGTLAVSNTTISGNSAVYFGGGIDNGGTLTVDGSTLSGNSAASIGGGIVNRGTLTVQSSTLSGNFSNFGGAISNRGTMAVDRSTLSGNSGNYGGGIDNSSGALAVGNCTLSGNSAYQGGGISNRGSSTLTVVGSTLSRNAASYAGGFGGGGIYSNSSGPSTLFNTIVAANFNDDILGAVAGGSSYNLIGVGTGLTGISNGSNGNRVGTAAAPIYPMLGPLQNNGGPTATMALLPGSPAINAGDNSLIPAGVTTDQRGTGYARIDSGTVDIGAYELVLNRPPTANAGGPYTIAEGGSLSLNGSGSSDPDPLDTLIYSWDVNGDGTFGDATGVSPTLTWVQLVALGINDGPRMVPNVRVRVDDGHAHVVDYPGTTLTVTNAEPTVGPITAPLDPFQVNTSISTSAWFTDPGTADTHTALWSWGDGTTSPGTVTESNGSGNVTDSHSYTAPGVYTVTLTVTDDDTGSGQSVYQYVVAYDPSAGFLTGGGWINSPEGAYAANPALTGKANFGFVSRYQNGNNVPTGNTEFQFKVADFNFKSTAYEWMVVSGAKARYRGAGTVNGISGYEFELTAWDGQAPGGGGVDRLRIKIWLGNQGNGVVYDNMMGIADGANPTTALGGGSIVIHSNGSPLLAAVGPTVGAKSARLTTAALQPIVQAAIDRWAAAGLDAAHLNVMRHATITVADLGGSYLGLADADTHGIRIDDDAAGYGWFVDATPHEDSEFARPGDRRVRGRMDLLSVIAHELGHLAGLNDDHNPGHASDVMGDSIATGTRRMPAAVDVAPAVADHLADLLRRRPARRR